jgi:hypothetical protein
MHEFGQYLCDTFKKAILSIPDNERGDIYAFALYQSDYDGKVSFSYNTRSHVESRGLTGEDYADAHWGYAYWRHSPWWNESSMEELGILPEGISWMDVVKQWAEEQRAIQDVGDDELDINGPLWDLYCDVARCIHASGIISTRFGRSIPIIMFDDDEGDMMDAATRSVNPMESLAEYIAHCDRRKAEWEAFQQERRE